MVEVQNLTIEYATAGGRVRAVTDVSFAIGPSEVLGLVGESGSGKSSVAMALLGHIAPSARIAAGRVLLDHQDILTLSPERLASYRGRRIGLVPQNPSMGLSPHLRVGRQLAEIVLEHGVVGGREEAVALARTQFMLVGLPDPDVLLRRYPHELSGGQQQRVCIAMALACRPELLVLDEPTTGLDVTTQARILDLLKEVRARFGIGMLYVTHDLALLAQIADRVGVMYAGRLIEIAGAERIFTAPRHPYTRALIASVPGIEARAAKGRRLRGLLLRDTLPPGCPFFPRCDHARSDCARHEQVLESAGPGHAVACERWSCLEEETQPRHADTISTTTSIAPSPARLLEIETVSLRYARSGRWRRLFGSREKPIVEGLTLSIGEGEVFALVGESGSGKSTIARALSGLLAPIAGEIRFRGAKLGRLRSRPLPLKRDIQYVFQNPDASLNPRERVRNALGRPLRLYFRAEGAEKQRRVTKALEDVRLDPSYAVRFPDQLSGGERQRVAIARSLVADPSLILCDEVLTALDVSVQASIIDLLARLRRDTGVAILFISHDLSVVRALADRVGVLFHGTLVEVGSTRELFGPPFHPYTEELLLTVPSMRSRRQHGRAIPRPKPPSSRGCVYAGRCGYHRGVVCDEEAPPWRMTASGHGIRCHIPLPELAAENLLGRAERDGNRTHERTEIAQSSTQPGR